MRLEDYESILDSLPSTGIYVIREEDQRIYILTAASRRRCLAQMWVWSVMRCGTGSCKNCPLLYIGNKKRK